MDYRERTRVKVASTGLHTLSLRITKAISKALGISKGDIFEISARGDTITYRRVQTHPVNSDNPFTGNPPTGGQDDLITSFCDKLIAEGRKISDGLDELNQLDGKKYQHRDIARWRNGQVVPGRAQHNHMLCAVLHDKLKKAGLGTREIRSIISAVVLPEKKPN